MTTNGWYHTTYVSRKWLPQKFNWFFSLRRKCLLTYLHLPKSEEILYDILPDMLVYSRSCLLWDGVVDPGVFIEDSDRFWGFPQYNQPSTRHSWECFQIFLDSLSSTLSSTRDNLQNHIMENTILTEPHSEVWGHCLRSRRSPNWKVLNEINSFHKLYELDKPAKTRTNSAKWKSQVSPVI